MECKNGLLFQRQGKSAWKNCADQSLRLKRPCNWYLLWVNEATKTRRDCSWASRSNWIFNDPILQDFSGPYQILQDHNVPLVISHMACWKGPHLISSMSSRLNEKRSLAWLEWMKLHIVDYWIPWNPTKSLSKSHETPLTPMTSIKSNRKTTTRSTWPQVSRNSSILDTSGRRVVGDGDGVCIFVTFAKHVRI